MTPADPKNARVILATDCGSTTTKAILIQQVDGVYRQTHRGEAPTTVEAPFADVTIGVVNAVTEVQELAGRRLIGDDGRIIHPATEREGCDIYISTSSAGGGLQMMVAGVVREMTGESAKRAALGAGAIVMDVIASNDRRKPHEQIQRIRELRPDIMLISGGVDGGTTTHVVQIAELVAPAKPRPRFGGEYQLPIIYAGNKDAAPLVRKVLESAEGFALTVVDNLRPVLERENLGPARDAIHDLFLEHVMAHAPGYDKLMKWTDAPIMPTPGAVGNILQTIAERQGINVVGVDIGGATTDVFSVFDRVFNRTVSANLGMSYSISNVCAEAGMPNILRWVPFEMDARELSNRVKNKMIRPTTIPQTLDELQIEHAIAREALRLALIHHKSLATALKGIQQERTISDVFEQQQSGKTLIDMLKLDLIVGSGGILSHAPRRIQSMLMMVDAYEPLGVTRLSVDSIFMMPHLGVLSTIDEKAATDVFVRDCMVYLGTCVAPIGQGKDGERCADYAITFPDGRVDKGQLSFGDLRLVPLAGDQKASIAIQPVKQVNLGAGAGVAVTREVQGGVVGLLLDGRGRPLQLPADHNARVAALQKWYDAVGLYPTAS